VFQFNGLGPAGRLAAAAIAMAAAFVWAPAPSEAAARPPVDAFVADNALTSPALSPSGRYLAYVSTADGLDTLVVTDLGANTASEVFKTRALDQKVTNKDARQQIVAIQWKGEDHLIVSLAVPSVDLRKQEITGWRTIHFVMLRDGTKATALNASGYGSRPSIGRAGVLDLLPKDPDHILFDLRDAAGKIYVFRYDVKDASNVQIESGSADVVEFGVDRNGVIVTRLIVAGLYPYYLMLQGRAPGEKDWTKIAEFHRNKELKLDEMEILGASDTENQLYVLADQPDGGGDTRAVRLYDLQEKQLGKVVWSHPKYDASSIFVNQDGKFLAGCYWADVEVCDFQDKTLGKEFDGLAAYFKGERNFSLVSRAEDNSKWVIYASGEGDPGSVYVYDLKTKSMSPLGSERPTLDGAPLGKTRRIDFKARDGTLESGYLTLPAQPAASPPPLVVMPHGGPQARDSLSYDEWVAFLASRGYAVLQVNFRGSYGFGKRFMEAGFDQWGGVMSDDLDDGVKAVLAGGEVDAKRVCIVGASYGGYAALYAAATEPQTYKCAVSIAGVSDLVEDMNWERKVRGADSADYKYLLKAEGDPGKEADRLAAKSPARMAKTWSVPLLLMHGDADDIVDVNQSRLMKKALEKEGKQVRYVEVKDEGHPYWAPKDEATLLRELDSFLGEHLMGQPPAAPAKAGGG
jgi:dipeptidyl aminopeptidase/acylaminoacyl peptidase